MTRQIMNYFTTDAFPGRFRALSWRDHVNRLYPTIDLLGASREDFSGRITWRDVGVTRISRIDSTAQRLLRTDRHARLDHERLLQLNFQIQGEGAVEQDGRSAVTRPGQFVIYDSARPYEMRFVGPFQQASLELPRSAIAAEVRDLDRMMARPIDGKSGAGRFLFELVRALACDEDPADHALAPRLQRHVCELLVTALTSLSPPAEAHPAPRRRTLEAVKRYVRERLDDPELSPASIAASQHMSLRYLHALFRADSSSPARWIQAERLERCRADLADPVQRQRSICEIAHHWGFRDAAHFSRVFRRRFGKTPSESRACRIVHA
ncbi:MAG TPA: helix-turn-helix domain-containing protein [Steroidobacteraceae bacterium]|nr:helix-turn-helix domain-containing protein [Steroidobacteraceae bacterium]